MKKTFDLSHPKIKYPRRLDAVRSEIKKYIKRERRVPLPEDVDFWDFDCKFGATADEAKEIHLAEISKCIDSIEEQKLESFYLEILAKHGNRTKKPRSAKAAEKKAAAKKDVSEETDVHEE